MHLQNMTVRKEETIQRSRCSAFLTTPFGEGVPIVGRRMALLGRAMVCFYKLSVLQTIYAVVVSAWHRWLQFAM